MSTSLVHVMKIIGPRAGQLANECDRLHAQRCAVHPRGLSSEDWSAEAHQSIDRLCEDILSDHHRLPTAYSAQYIDSWSVAASNLASVTARGYRGRLWSDSWAVWYHALPDRGWLKSRIAQLRQHRVYKRQAEDRWLIDHVHEAARYAHAHAFDRPAIIMALIRGIGASRSDDEYRRCLLSVNNAEQAKAGRIEDGARRDHR